MAGDYRYRSTYEEEYIYDFCLKHKSFFWGDTRSRGSINEAYLEVLWPKIDEFLAIWSNSKATNYFAAGHAMQETLKEAGLEPPQWPPEKPRPSLRDDRRHAHAQWDACLAASSGGIDAAAQAF